MDKETLLDTLNTNWQTLTQLLEGIPHEELEYSTFSNGQSIKEILCLLTAWDGEAIRRIRFITGQSTKPPHDPFDTSYWHNWEKKQIEIKRIMSVKGIMVDMVSTRQRLLTCILPLNDFYFQRWLNEDPHVTSPYYQEWLKQLKTWRLERDASHPHKTRFGQRWSNFLKKLFS